MRRFQWILLLLALVAVSSACVSGGGRRVEGPRTTLRVENRNFLDMNVFVVRGGQRIRLGTAPGLSTRTLTIPAGLVFGVTSLRFLADPVGGNAYPVTQDVSVVEGDEVTLYISP